MRATFDYLEEVEDLVTGTQGYVTAVVHYYDNGVTEYRIDYQNKNGSLIQEWIDSGRLQKCEGGDC